MHRFGSFHEKSHDRPGRPLFVVDHTPQANKIVHFHSISICVDENGGYEGVLQSPNGVV